MILYTSYFAQIRNFPKNLVGLSTAIWPPKWREFGKGKDGIIVIDCPPLHPGPQCAGLCTGKCEPKHPENCAFLQTYRDQLDNINLEDFLIKLEKLANKIKKEENLEEVDFAFLVYEAPTNSCSERIAIQEWGAYTGLDIKEWRK